MERHYWFGLMCSAVLPMGSPAHSQASEPQIGTEPEVAEQGDAIIVTARKRVETLQDVPMAVTVVSDTQLDRRGSLDVNALYTEVPGLFTAPGSVNNSADFAYLTMRSVGFNAGLEPAVGVFLDGMYLPQIGFDLPFLDVERIEVLRGPQGTLFGRNTQGGAVNIVTRKPGPETRGKLLIEGAEFGTFRVSGSASAPIASGLFGGVSGSYSRTNGYLDNIVLGGDQDWSKQYALRGVLRYAPTNAVDVSLIADISKRNYNEAIRGVRLSSHRYESVVDQDKADSKRNVGIQLNVTSKLSNALTLSSITGYRETASDVFTDMDSRITPQNEVTLPPFPPVATTPQTFKGATLDVEIEQRFLSQELRLDGKFAGLEWLIGGYYFDQRQAQRRDRQVGPGIAPFPGALYIYEDYRDDRQGYAVFANASYRPIERIELTAGARWSHESVEGTGDRGQVFGPPVNRTQAIVRDAKKSFNNLSWMASAAFKPNARLLAYATYAEGWKAGGINRFPGSNSTNLPYDDESSKNYEVGLKSGALDGRLALSLAAYHIKIRDQQLLNVIPDPAGGPTPQSVVENAARSHVNGAEAEMTVEVSPRLKLAGAFAYSRSRFDSFVRTFSSIDQTDFAGTRFENVPQTTLFASALYVLPLRHGRSVEFYGEYQHVGSIVIQDNTRASTSGDQLTAPAYDRVNMSAAFVPREGLRITAYVNNLFDSFDYSFPSSDPLLGGDVFGVPLPPRQFGVRAALSF